MEALAIRAANRLERTPRREVGFFPLSIRTLAQPNSFLTNWENKINQRQLLLVVSIEGRAV